MCFPQKGKQRKVKTVKSGKNVVEVAPMQDVETVQETEVDGVIVQCVKEKGKLRIRPVSAGYNCEYNGSPKLHR